MRRPRASTTVRLALIVVGLACIAHQSATTRGRPTPQPIDPAIQARLSAMGGAMLEGSPPCPPL